MYHKLVAMSLYVYTIVSGDKRISYNFAYCILIANSEATHFTEQCVGILLIYGAPYSRRDV